ncbi:MAG: hypothetical protein JXR46_08455 [Calditrichaceae bacterium]|nr:hypothetical protein [Calditrichaceae bacterium]MBN2709062.1 hypothetical protein [Calditrichaceae bacterium]RQV97020.1 MAG: hypothetical protein EH224_02680 [Calditrichota bacterium]
MAALRGFSLADHLFNIDTEYKFNKTIYAYPDKKIFRGYNGYDFSIKHFGAGAYTPLGPAAGPHTQLAQNIVCAFLAGARCFELKTIQINDRIKVSRPCIDIRNIGYNIEWSQELSLNDSLQEYLKAWLLLKYIKQSGILNIKNDSGFYDFVFDVSVGYDYKGITSKPVTDWLNTIKTPETGIEKLIADLPDNYKSILSKIEPAPVSETITLSTFHGCPADEIEHIASFLLSETGFNVIIKFNPTLLGYDQVCHILYGDLGYTQLILDQKDFEKDLKLDSAIGIIKRLSETAQKCHRRIGVKFTNTLVVKNTESIFKDPIRYLSGAPLYLIALKTLNEFRRKYKTEISVAFSGGINRYNFPQTLQGDIFPVTVCSDLLKKGGYHRLNNYFISLKEAFETAGVSSISDFIRKDHPNGISENQAGIENINHLIHSKEKMEEQSFDKNSRLPKKTNQILKTFDCLNCDICLKVCPNLAIIALTFPETTLSGNTIVFTKNGYDYEKEEVFQLQKNKQIFVIDEACNDCGNCTTFCPETGDPNRVKISIYRYHITFINNPDKDGIFMISPSEMLIRINGETAKLTSIQNKKLFSWETIKGRFVFDEDNQLIDYTLENDFSGNYRLSVMNYLTARLFYRAVIYNSTVYPIPILLNSREI